MLTGIRVVFIIFLTRFLSSILRFFLLLFSRDFLHLWNKKKDFQKIIESQKLETWFGWNSFISEYYNILNEKYRKQKNELFTDTKINNWINRITCSFIIFMNKQTRFIMFFVLCFCFVINCYYDFIYMYMDFQLILLIFIHCVVIYTYKILP